MSVSKSSLAELRIPARLVAANTLALERTSQAVRRRGRKKNFIPVLETNSARRRSLPMPVG